MTTKPLHTHEVAVGKFRFETPSDCWQKNTKNLKYKKNFCCTLYFRFFCYGCKPNFAKSERQIFTAANVRVHTLHLTNVIA